MVFMSLEFTGKIPFSEVLIHPVIQTPDGKRMSKSKGNAINPLEMIDKYGADANRFWYFSVGIMGNQDVRFPGTKGKDGTWESSTLEQYRRFSNKLWNAVNFVKQNLESEKKYDANFNLNDILDKLSNKNLTIADRWILSCYGQLLSGLSESFKAHKFSNVADELHGFIWFSFCDWYIEIAKRQLAEPSLKEQTQEILFYIVEGITRALHPIMPFITEEIWQLLPVKNKSKFLLLEKYPQGDAKDLNDSFRNDSLKFSYIVQVTSSIRNQRQTLNLPWTKEIEVKLFNEDDFEKNALIGSMSYIEFLTKSKVTMLSKFELVKPSTGFLISKTRGIIPLAPISDVVDIDSMLINYNKKKAQYEKDVQSCKTKLDNPNFVNNAAPEKVEEVKNQVKELENQIKTIDEQVGLLR